MPDATAPVDRLDVRPARWRAAGGRLSRTTKRPHPAAVVARRGPAGPGGDRMRRRPNMRRARHRLPALRASRRPALRAVGTQRRAGPHRAGGLLDGVDQRPLSCTAKSSRGCSDHPWFRSSAVVDDVDAADEGDVAIHRAQLLVQPSQLAGCSMRATSGPPGEKMVSCPCRLQPLRNADSVALEPKPSGPPGAPSHRAGPPPPGPRHPGRIVVEDVGGHPHPVLRAKHCPAELGEQLVASGERAALRSRRSTADDVAVPQRSTARKQASFAFRTQAASG